MVKLKRGIVNLTFIGAAVFLLIIGLFSFTGCGVDSDDDSGSSNTQNTNGNNGIVIDGTIETY